MDCVGCALLSFSVQHARVYKLTWPACLAFGFSNRESQVLECIGCALLGLSVQQANRVYKSNTVALTNLRIDCRLSHLPMSDLFRWQEAGLVASISKHLDNAQIPNAFILIRRRARRSHWSALDIMAIASVSESRCSIPLMLVSSPLARKGIVPSTFRGSAQR